MLNELVESGSHAASRKRRGSFFLYTCAAYGLLLTLAGAASIYAYDAHITAETAEHIEFLYLPPPEAPREIAPRAPQLIADTASAPRNTQIMRVEPIASVTNSTRPPDSVSTVPSTVPSIPDGAKFKIGAENSTGAPAAPTGGQPGGSADPNATGSTFAHTIAPPLPPPPVVRPTPAPVEAPKPPRRISIGVLNGRALSLPMPSYPTNAQQIRLSGTVVVQVVIDETGRVTSAQAVSGHPFFRPSAVRAARAARFAPTLLSNQPVTVQGVINYNFKLDN